MNNSTTNNTTDSNEQQGEALLPCPFCGSHAHIRQTRIPEGSRLIAYWIECAICEVGTKYNDNKGDAIAIWNTRSRASLADEEGDVIHWVLKAGVEEAMCGVSAREATSLLQEYATCEKCKAAAWGYQRGRADERAAASSQLPVEPPPTCGPARPDDGSECAYGICPRPRDGCSEYCWQHHKSQCAAPAEPQQEGGQERQVQCADCQSWFNPDSSHTCRQQVRRNQRSAR